MKKIILITEKKEKEKNDKHAMSWFLIAEFQGIKISDL